MWVGQRSRTEKRNIRRKCEEPVRAQVSQGPTGMCWKGDFWRQEWVMNDRKQGRRSGVSPDHGGLECWVRELGLGPETSWEPLIIWSRGVADELSIQRKPCSSVWTMHFPGATWWCGWGFWGHRVNGCIFVYATEWLREKKLNVSSQHLKWDQCFQIFFSVWFQVRVCRKRTCIKIWKLEEKPSYYFWTVTMVKCSGFQLVLASRTLRPAHLSKCWPWGPAAAPGPAADAGCGLPQPVQATAPHAFLHQLPLCIPLWQQMYFSGDYLISLLLSKLHFPVPPIIV